MEHQTVVYISHMNVIELFLYNGVIADEKGRDNWKTIFYMINQNFVCKIKCLCTNGR